MTTPDTATRRYARLELADGRQTYVRLTGTAAEVLDAPPWRDGSPTGERLPEVDDQGRGSSARRLTPVEPSKILCVGRNYRAHAAELGNPLPAEPLLFLKPPSALLDPDGTLELPPPELSTRVEHEVELGVVIGSRARRVSVEHAAQHIFGYTVVGDITARDLQRQDKQWTRGKGMDGFCPVGPVVLAGGDTSASAIRCRVNDELRQDGTTADMVFSPAFVVAYASQVMTLEPGDLIATGTPAGVGPLVGEDAVEMSIEGIGSLPFTIRAPATGGSLP